MQGPARLTLAVASHRSPSRAAADCAALWETRADRAPGHTAVALLQRRPGGVLGIERYSSTAKHLLWGGALLGGPLLVWCRSAGEELLTAVGLSGAGSVIGHLRRYLDPAGVAAAGRVLDHGDVGLVVAVLDSGPACLPAGLSRADATFTAQLPWAELAAQLCPDADGPWPDQALAAG
jgi:hypothetical protein